MSFHAANGPACGNMNATLDVDAEIGKGLAKGEVERS